MIIHDLKELERVYRLLMALDNNNVGFPILVENQRGRARVILSTGHRHYAYTNAQGNVDIVPQSRLAKYSKLDVNAQV